MSTDPPRVLSVAPASGWWAVYRAAPADGSPRWYRRAVACWATVEGESGVEVLAMVAGNGYELAFPDADDGFSHLVEDELLGACSCGRGGEPRSASTTDDSWFCDQCGAKIERWTA